MSGMFSGPRTGVELGVFPSIITVTPWGMLAIRTMQASCSGLVLAGTFINNPGSMCNASPAVENGGQSASLTAASSADRTS